MFAGAPFIAEGVIHNVSQAGCTVESDRIVLNGSYLIVRLLLPDAAHALSIELAAIRWVRQGYFGLEFLRIPPADRVRLDRFLFDHHR